MKKLLLIVLVLIIFSLNITGYSSKTEEKLFFNQGYFGTVSLYQSYLNIGMVTDLWSKKIYTPENSKEILKMIKGFMSGAIGNLKDLSELQMTKSDKEGILQLMNISKDLYDEAVYILKYMDSKDQSDLDQYQYFRKMAWKKLQDLMKK
ncbi:MAG: hypothetical protein ABFR75_11330 [Acidobacteriota bacterium]